MIFIKVVQKITQNKEAKNKQSKKNRKIRQSKKKTKEKQIKSKNVFEKFSKITLIIKYLYNFSELERRFQN